MATEVKSLSSGTYTLQVRGSGSVICYYGTATENNYLVFTVAVSTLVKFDTEGEVTRWHLHAGGIPLPYVPPGVTQPSAAATTGGNGMNVLMDRKILEAFRGKPDGVELGTTPQVTNFVNQNGRFIKTLNTSSGNISLNGNILNEGDRAILRFTVESISGGYITPYIGGAALPVVSLPGVFALEGFAGQSVFTDASFYASTTTLCVISSISIQRLTPAVCTVMHEAYIGVGSGYLAGDGTPKTMLTQSSVPLLYFRGDAIADKARIVTSFDGAYYVDKIATWSANEIHRRYVQTNGTKFRVGHERFNADMTPITSGIVWSHASVDAGITFDGSFNPLTWLRFGLNLTVPIWHRKCWIDYKCLSDQEIQYRNKLVGG